MKTNTNSNREKQASCDDEITAEVLDQRFERSKKRLEFEIQGKPVPTHLEEPVWVGRILDEISNMNLPLDERNSELFREGAELGYNLALARDRCDTMQKIKKLELSQNESTDVSVGHETDKILTAYGRELSEYNLLSGGRLTSLPLPKYMDFLNGVIHGMNCRAHRIKNSTPIKKTPRWIILDTILRYQEGIQHLVDQKKTALEISKFIATRLRQPYRQEMQNEFDGKGNKTDAWADFVGRVSRICRDLGIPLANLGRPKGTGHPKHSWK